MRNSYLIREVFIIPALLISLSLISFCSRDMPRNVNDPKYEGGTATTPVIQQSTVVDSFGSVLETRLTGTAGLTEPQAAVIVSGAKLEALTVVNARITRGFNEDVRIIAPAIVRGAMEKMPDAGLSVTLILAAIKEISGSPVEALNGNMDNLTSAEKNSLIKSIAQAAAGNLDKTGLTTLADIQDAMKEVSSGAVSSLGKAGLKDPATIADFVREVNAGAVIGLGEIKNNITGLAANLESAIAKLAEGSVSSLDNIEGLSKEQIAYISKMVTRGIVSSIAEAGITDSAIAKAIITESTKAAVGALGDAGLDASYITNAATGIADASYNSLTGAGLTPSTELLDAIKNATKAGFDIIVIIVADFDSIAASNSVDTYDGTYSDPYENALTTFTIGGTVTGLTSGTLVLQNNGVDDLSLTADETFFFATALDDDSAYNITVLTQPTGLTCTVTAGTGTISGAFVDTVEVTCASSGVAYTIGGTVNGLTSGTLFLQNNGVDDLSLTADGTFSFDTALNDGSAYNVTVLTQPTDLTCTVTAGTGTISGANVTVVDVQCATSTSVVYCIADQATIPCIVQ